MTIRLDRIGKRFNREWIFRHLSASFAPGEIVAIVGANGSGKSTLLSVLWAQTPPSEGDIRFETASGEIPAEEAFAHFSIAAPYMDLADDFTPREQIDFHFSFKNPINAGGHSSLLESIGLAHVADRPIRAFSSGMKQRLKLGLAFFSDTPVLFLDEPTTNLDRAAMHWYTDLLARSTRRLIFIATNTHEDYPKEAKLLDLAAFKST